MDKFDRLYQLHRVLAARRTPVSVAELQRRLDDCSRSTVYRLLQALKLYLGAPVVRDLRTGGFGYQTGNGAAFELPGLWFSAEELQSLLLFRQLLSRLDPGLLEEHLQPLTVRVQQLLSHRTLGLTDAADRFHLSGTGARPVGPAFRTAAAATLRRKRLCIEYHSRDKDEVTTRLLSPQRLTHYRGNWYVDAWDHSRRAMRRFSVDRIKRAEVLPADAVEQSKPRLDRHFASSYGIFGGAADKTAVLRFCARRARWVADESWHPQQRGRWLDDGSYELRLPYRDARELILDILRYGADVEVLRPAALRTTVRQQLAAALGRYADPPKPARVTAQAPRAVPRFATTKAHSPPQKQIWRSHL
jgi:proteasome accessory factor C